MHMPAAGDFHRYDAMPVDHRLTALERHVLLVARADADRFDWEGVASPSRVAAIMRRLLTVLTGIGTVQPFADRRLEALRLFACMLRRGDARAGRVAEALLADGFSEAALREAMGLALS